MKKNNPWVVIAAVLAGVLIGALAMYWLGGDYLAQTRVREALYYRDPTGSGLISQTPRQNKNGAPYVAVYADDPAGVEHAPAIVVLDPAGRRGPGIQTTPVVRAKAVREIAAPGAIVPEDARLDIVTTKVDGYIEKLYVTAAGKWVPAGDPLFDLYSPALASLMEEFLAALRYQGSIPPGASPDIHRNATELVVAAHKRLKMLGLESAQLAKIQSERSAPRAVTFFAERSGTVLKKHVVQGSYVPAATAIFTLADLSQVWVLAEVSASDFSALSTGQPTKVIVQGGARKTYEGRVDFIYPTIDAHTHTVKVRITVPNPGQALRPGVGARVVIMSAAGADELSVPKSAVLRSGKHSVVILALGDGRFRPWPVRLGGEAGENYIIAEGVNAGDAVVTAAQSLLNAENKINEAVQKLIKVPLPPASAPSAAVN